MVEAYCGPPPEPQTLLAAWNVDMVAVALCAGLAVAHLYRSDSRGREYLWAAIALLLILFISPLCALTVALFSARAAHHLLLVAVAAPLLALAFDHRWRGNARTPLSLLVGTHAAILWFWHVPQVYATAIAGAVPYWVMQASLLGSAFFLWRRILSLCVPVGHALLALLATATQMGMLGALLTFARAPLYAPHFATTLPYGLTPIADQQLAGLIMWVPAAVPYLVATVLLLAARLDRAARAAG